MLLPGNALVAGGIPFADTGYLRRKFHGSWHGFCKKPSAVQTTQRPNESPMDHSADRKKSEANMHFGRAIIGATELMSRS
jgi:hypothetical protein